MEIRDATPVDLSAITDLYNAFSATTYEYSEFPHTLEERTAWFTDQCAMGLPVLVADDDGSVVGFASYGPFRDNRRWPGYRFTVEHTIHVDESQWRQGVGRKLLDALIARARAADIRVMVAGIDSSNVGSIAFHSRLGFVETARMPGVGEKWGKRLELVLMQRELSETPP